MVGGLYCGHHRSSHSGLKRSIEGGNEGGFDRCNKGNFGRCIQIRLDALVKPFATAIKPPIQGAQLLKILWEGWVNST